MRPSAALSRATRARDHADISWMATARDAGRSENASRAPAVPPQGSGVLCANSRRLTFFSTGAGQGLQGRRRRIGPAVVLSCFFSGHSRPDDGGDQGQGLRARSSREPPVGDGALQDGSCHRVQGGDFLGSSLDDTPYALLHRAPASAFRAASTSTYRRSERLLGRKSPRSQRARVYSWTPSSRARRRLLTPAPTRMARASSGDGSARV